MLVNIVYMLMVPFEVQRVPNVDVASEFFKETVGTLSSKSLKLGTRIQNGFMAVSSLGNNIVMTRTAARVKQEIAIEGFCHFVCSSQKVSRCQRYRLESFWPPLQ